MEAKNENSDVSRAEEMKNQANEAFKGVYFCFKNTNRTSFFFNFSFDSVLVGYSFLGGI